MSIIDSMTSNLQTTELKMAFTIRCQKIPAESGMKIYGAVRFTVFADLFACAAFSEKLYVAA